jgi:hypothetical protein
MQNFECNGPFDWFFLVCTSRDSPVQMCKSQGMNCSGTLLHSLLMNRWLWVMGTVWQAVVCAVLPALFAVP